MEFKEEHVAFRKVMRDFADSEIAPHAQEWDRTRTFPLEAIAKMGALGLFGLPFDEAYGGSNSDFTTLCIAVEELARVDQSIAITLEAAVGLGINPIAEYGTSEQRDRWLPDLVAGRSLAGFGLTEPGAGSDAAATRTRADLIDGTWVVNGSKAFITSRMHWVAAGASSARSRAWARAFWVMMNSRDPDRAPNRPFNHRSALMQRFFGGIGAGMPGKGDITPNWFPTPAAPPFSSVPFGCREKDEC